MLIEKDYNRDVIYIETGILVAIVTFIESTIILLANEDFNEIITITFNTLFNTNFITIYLYTTS